MHPRAILAIARKDAIDILLNRTTVMALLSPIIVSIFFLLISKLIAVHTINMLVYNPTQSPVVQVVSKAFAQVHISETSSPAEVTAAFGPNGAHESATYDVGLIVPANFESLLQAGKHPQMSLYLNGDNLNIQDNQLIQAAITNYARQVANPQPAVILSTSMINPPSPNTAGNLVNSLYSMMSLLVSFMVGVTLVPGLLIEEKEKKTLRMLMVTPASFLDVILGKLLITLVYQLLLSLIVLTIQNGFVGQVPLVLLYTLVGACMSLAIGLLLGGTFQNASGAATIGGMLTFIYILPAIFSGPLGSVLGNSTTNQLMKVFPTYYIADGVYNAMQSQGTFGAHLLDLSVILGTTLILFVLTTLILRRQASVVASI